ncbi:MAG TPA: S-layer homology domain-containing protein, partial [Egibacteraceae bacterium]|nr:S-layer homology domain-containing protein [Egibacteraceae bacterium]
VTTHRLCRPVLGGRQAAGATLHDSGRRQATDRVVVGVALGEVTGERVVPGDLTESNAHYDAIRRLAAAGIVQGGPGGLPATQYGPAQSVRRDQMASFIRRAIDEIAVDARAEIVSDEDVFSDAAAVHLENVNALASEGIVLGVGEGQYAGGRAVRRDQMASFVNRGLDFLVQHKQSLLPALTVR